MICPLNGSHLAGVIDGHRTHAMLARDVLQIRCEAVATGRALDRLQSPV
jgi:hypothetical protein